MNTNLLLFGAYPYVAGTVFLLGSLIRYDREQYTWTSYSTQLLGSRQSLAWGSNLWHIGVLFIFLGHFVGLLTPAFDWLHVPPVTHQWIAASAGITFGVLALIGGLLLLARRLANSQVRAAAHSTDLFILLWLLATLAIGLATQYVTLPNLLAGHVADMEILSRYLKGLVLFQPHPALVAPLPWVYKLHLLFGMTLFLLFPFTRLVHIWTVPVNYLWRSYQLVRARPRMRA